MKNHRSLTLILTAIVILSTFNVNLQYALDLQQVGVHEMETYKNGSGGRSNNHRMIPKSFIFIDTRYHVLEDLPEHVHANVNQTVRLYRKFWGEPNAPVQFYGNRECKQAINVTQPGLLRHFLREKEGAYLSDICRTAALQMTGGHYFDNDMKVVEPLPLDDNITFSTATEFGNKGLFISFIFVAQGHPVPARALELLLLFYEGKHRLHSLLGPSIWKDAYDEQPQQVKRKSFILDEIFLNAEPYRIRYKDFPRLGGVGCCCDYAVEDPIKRKIFFYSRMLGAGKNCNFPKTPVKPRVQQIENPLTFIHIPQTGGTAIEVAGAKHGLSWAVCLWGSAVYEVGQPCPKNARKLGDRNKFGVSMWHLPPSFFEGNLNPYDTNKTDIFTVVRDPYDRIVSEFNSQNGMFDKRNVTSETMNYILRQRLTVFIAAERDSPNYFMHDAHWIPQVDFLYNSKGQRLKMKILRFERLQEDFQDLLKQYPQLHLAIGSLPTLNAFQNDFSAKDLDNATRALIQKAYKRDFEEFKYPT